MLNRIKTALVVDDSPHLRAMMAIFLESYHVSIFEAENGADAIRVLGDNEIDLLVTDFRMPTMDGVELLAWCRSAGRHMPVIFTTSERRLMPRELIALGDCCATYVRKPFDYALLDAALIAADSKRHHQHCLHMDENASESAWC